MKKMKAEELYKSNMDFLSDHAMKRTLSCLENPSGASDLKVTLNDKSGFYDFTVERDGREIYLHSRRDPEREAQRQVEEWLKQENPSSGGTILVLGFGGGYHLKPLLEFMTEGGMLFVIDPNVENFKKSLEYCDLNTLSKEGVDVFFSATEKPIDSAREFRKCLHERRTINLAVFFPPGIKRVNEGDFDAIFSSIKDEVRQEGLDRNTIASTGDEWLQNSLINLPYILKSPPVDVLKNTFKDSTAIMAGAGPSLNDSIPYIKEHADDYVIFAVGTALKPLLNAGIEPDFVVALDCHPLILKQFEGIEGGDYFLLSPSFMISNILYRFKEKMFIFSTPQLPGFNTWLDSLNALPDTLAIGGTVSLTAIDIARYTGCSRIIFTGLDLAFAEDGTTHASKSMYENNSYRYGACAPAKVKGNYSEEVGTTRQFATYIRILESYIDDVFKEGAPKLYNATSGGAYIRGAELIRPSEISNFKSSGLAGNKSIYIRELHRKAEVPDEEKIMAKISETIDELNDLSKKAGSAVRACGILLESGLKYSKGLLDELDSLDCELKENSPATALATGAMQTVILDIYARSAAGGIDQQRVGIENNLKFYEHFKGAAEWISGLLEIAEQGLKCKDYRFSIGN